MFNILLIVPEIKWLALTSQCYPTPVACLSGHHCRAEGNGKTQQPSRIYSLRTEEQSLQGQPPLQQLTETSRTPLLTAHPGTTHLHLQAPGESPCASPNQTP